MAAAPLVGVLVVVVVLAFRVDDFNCCNNCRADAIRSSDGGDTRPSECVVVVEDAPMVDKNNFRRFLFLVNTPTVLLSSSSSWSSFSSGSDRL